MANAKRYYSYDKENTLFYLPLHITIENHLADLLFNGDNTRIIYAPNSFALRKRSEDNKENTGLNYPFCNFRKTDWNFNDRDGIWNSRGFYSGVFIPELQRKVRYCPVEISFEAMVWMAREDDIAYAQHLLRMDSDGRTLLTFDLNIDGVPLEFRAEFLFESIDLDKEYNEIDWLNVNNIHTISLNFTAKTIDIIDTKTNEDLRSGSNYAITEKIIFDFASRHMVTDVSFQEALEFTVNHFSETVE